MISVLMFFACLYPVFLWVGLGLTGGLTANPPEYLIRSSGEWALVALCVVLLATPLSRYARISVLLKHRRMLGLFAYFYSILHLLGWAFWEQGFGLEAMWLDVVTRWFITVGCVASGAIGSACITAFIPRSGCRYGIFGWFGPVKTIFLRCGFIWPWYFCCACRVLFN